MAKLEELVLELSADTKSLQAELKSAQNVLSKSANTMSKSITDFSKTTESSSSIVKQAFATMAGFIGSQVVIGAFNAVKDAAGFLFDTLIVDGIEAASATQTALNNLNNSLARTGQFTKGTSDEMLEFASAMQSTSVFSDDLILSTTSLIQNVARLDKEALKGATQASMNLAAALGVDLATAGNLVARSIEGNVGALKRYGIEVEAGASKSETLNNVLTTLNSRFGGAAQSQLQTYSGSVAALQNQFSDLTKVFGSVVIENKAVTNVITAVSKIIADFQNGLDPQALRVYFAQGLDAAISFAQGLVKGIDLATSGFRYFADIISFSVGKIVELASTVVNFVSSTQIFKDAVNGISQAFSFVTGKVEQFASAAGEAMPSVASTFKELKDEFSDNSVNPAIDSIAGALEKMRQASQEGLEQTKQGMIALVEPTNQVVAATQELTAEQQRQLDLAIELANTQIANGTNFLTMQQSEVENMKLAFEEKLISEEEYQAAKLALLMQTQEAERAMLEEGLAAQNASVADAEAARLAQSTAHEQQLRKLALDTQATKDKLREKELQNASDMFGNLATLSKTNSKELGAIGKASAMAQAIINTYQGATKALAQGGLFGPALAASVVAAGLANVAKIAATPLQSGIDEIPGIGTKDNFPAMLAPGERVVPNETNKDLKEFMKNNTSNGNTINITVNVNDVFASDPREVGRKIIEMINDAAQSNGIRMLGSGAI